MSAFEELLNIMRTERKQEQGTGIHLAVMTGPKTCRMGDFPLYEDDLYISDRLLQSVATKVAGHCPADGELTDQTEYNSALKDGDIVAVCKIGEAKYLILERVVSAA